MMASLSFWGMSPCIEETVKFASRIFSVSHSTLGGGGERAEKVVTKPETDTKGHQNCCFHTFLLVLQKMTAWVIVRVS